MDKIPFSVNGFFGYLNSGAVALFAVAMKRATSPTMKPAAERYKP